MCFFRKKPKVQIHGKYFVGQFVHFRYRADLKPGYVYSIHLDKDNNVVYDIQVGGECPAVIVNIKEEEIVTISSKK